MVKYLMTRNPAELIQRFRVCPESDVGNQDFRGNIVEPFTDLLDVLNISETHAFEDA